MTSTIPPRHKGKKKKICWSSASRICNCFPSYPYPSSSPASRPSCSQGLGLLSRACGHAGAGVWPTARTVAGEKWGWLRGISPASCSFSWIFFPVLRMGWREIMQLSNCSVGLLPRSILPSPHLPLLFFGVQPTDYVDTVEQSQGKGHRKTRPPSEFFSLFKKLSQL